MKEKTILFSQLLGPSLWQYKAAKALRKKNKKVSLFLVLKPKGEKKDLKETFSEIFSLNLENLKPLTIIKTFFLYPINFFHFLYKLFTIKPEVLVAEGAPHYLASIFIKLFKGRCPRIYFPYDMSYSRFKKPEKFIPKRELWGERTAFRECDAFIYKSEKGELDLIPKEFNILSKPILNFPCYVLSEWNKDYNPKKKLSLKDREIHIVHAGTFQIIKDHLGGPGKDIAKEFVKQHIHYHIYPARDKVPKEHVEEIAPTKELKKYLHIHDFVTPETLSEQLLSYDFGLYPVNYTNNAKPNAVKYPGTNKFATYLESAIPILVLKEVEMYSSLVEKNNIGVVIDKYPGCKKKLEKAMEKNKYKKMIKNLYKFRKEYSVENHINELLSFITLLKSSKAI